MKSTSKVIQGKTARRNGKEFEKMLDNYFSFLKKLRVACIEKTPEPFRYIKPLANGGGMFVATFIKSAQPDFKGVLFNGREIVLESKSVSNDRINLSALTDTEREELILHDEMHALSGVIVRQKETEKIFLFPTSFFVKMEELTGFKHIKFINAEKFEIKGIEKNSVNAFWKMKEILLLTPEQCYFNLQNRQKSI